jgi:hypothetical protein
MGNLPIFFDPRVFLSSQASAGLEEYLKTLRDGAGTPVIAIVALLLSSHGDQVRWSWSLYPIQLLRFEYGEQLHGMYAKSWQKGRWASSIKFNFKFYIN